MQRNAMNVVFQKGCGQCTHDLTTSVVTSVQDVQVQARKNPSMDWRSVHGVQPLAEELLEIDDN